MKVKPLSDRVLIEPNAAEEKTAGGLYIPDTAKEKPLAGKVVAVGPGTSEIKMEVKAASKGEANGIAVKKMLKEMQDTAMKYFNA